MGMAKYAEDNLEMFYERMAVNPRAERLFSAQAKKSNTNNPKTIFNSKKELHNEQKN